MNSDSISIGFKVKNSLAFRLSQIFEDKTISLKIQADTLRLFRMNTEYSINLLLAGID